MRWVNCGGRVCRAVLRHRLERPNLSGQLMCSAGSPLWAGRAPVLARMIGRARAVNQDFFAL